MRFSFGVPAFCKFMCKRLIFHHTTSPGCISAGYVDYAKKMIFQVKPIF